jgi:hypothetical protein
MESTEFILKRMDYLINMIGDLSYNKSFDNKSQFALELMERDLRHERSRLAEILNQVEVANVFGR